jgi:hypothetical protein
MDWVTDGDSRWVAAIDVGDDVGGTGYVIKHKDDGMYYLYEFLYGDPRTALTAPLSGSPFESLKAAQDRAEGHKHAQDAAARMNDFG